MSPEKTKALDEVAVLLSEVEIGPYKVKPWSFGRFKKVYPALSKIIPALQDLDLTPENAQEVLAEKGLEVIGNILPALSPVIAATLDIAEEEVEELDFGQAAALGLTILAQNLSRIKNSLPLIMDPIKAVIGGI
jgi:hypothetical protein